MSVSQSGSVSQSSDLALALELADEADRVTMAAFRRPGLVVETKPDMTPVTEADRGVEKALRAALASARPSDAVVGEEFGSTGTWASRDRRWIIDPIDGTKNFVRNVPVWATLIALEDDGNMTVGAVSAPALGRRWWAARGLGAFAGPISGPGERIHVSAVADLEHANLSAGGLQDWVDPQRPVALALRCARDRGFGDFWSHVLVAEGSCDIALDPVVSLWDLAALQVIVEEAGGRFTDLEGHSRSDGGSAVSTNGLLHDAALTVLTGGTAA